MVVIDPPEHIVCVVGVAKAFGVGFTDMLNVCDGPKQTIPALVNWGVTVICAVCTAVLLFVAVNDGMFPLPEAGNPMVVLLLLQLKTVA
jgi:hypothetical protein